MKPSTRRKTLLAVVMTLIMSLAFAGTAFAANITISNDGDKATVNGHQYGAYQIFTGEIENGQLTNILWGSSVDSSKLLEELNKNSEFTKGASLKTAVDVANALDGEGYNAVIAQWFADTVAKYVYDSPFMEVTGVDGEAVFENVPDGYYLIRDIGKIEKGQTATDFMLKVAGRDENVVPKAGTTVSDKTVEEDSIQKYQEYADAEINQVVRFKLSSTVPANIANYKNYWVEFQDTLSKGLTLDVDSFVVSVKKSNSQSVTLTQGAQYNLEVADATEPEDSAYKGGKYFAIKLDADKGGVLGDVTLESGDIIEVNYSATVNKDAIVGVDGNPNKFKTVYETNPNKDKGGEPEPGETPEKTVYVFTWELDSKKIDGADRHELKDAIFKLYRLNKDQQREYAEFESDGNTFMIKNWVNGGDGPAFQMITQEDGIFNIKGLDSEDVYYLEEVKAPDGYNQLQEPYKIQIGTMGAIEGNIQPEKITFTKKLGENGVEETEQNSSGIFEQEVLNMSGSTLPSTGGMGTIIFTVVGIAVMVVAAVVFVTRRRRSANLA